MKRLITLLLLLLLVVGCVGSSSVVGRYVDEEDESSYIELKKDGSVWIPMGTQHDPSDVIQLGTYKMEGSDITLTVIDRHGVTEIVKGTIEGKVMTLEIDGAGTFIYIKN